jgi:hypothetical protein
MTRYTVVWLQSEEDRLAEIWPASNDRAQVSGASQAIDADLARDAGLKGMPVADNVRLLVVPPLAVEYEVIEADRLVRELRVKHQ